MIPFSRLGAIVLAAGASRRMQGEHKLTKLFRGRPLIEWCLETVASLGLAHAAVITGHEADKIAAIARKHGLAPVHNPAFASGVGFSIAAGAAAMAPSIEGAFIVLGDMPLIEREDFAALVQIFDPEAGRDIATLTYGGRRGHPVLLGRSHFPALMALTGDKGAAHLFAAYRERVTSACVRSAHIFADLDEAADFLRFETAGGRLSR